ncbi:MAG TPA: hypothetical protein VF516_21365 [Kofleriaceae bacterium]
MTDIKNLELLKSRLEASHPVDGRLTLKPEMIPDGDFLAFLRTLPQQQLVLEDPKVTPTGSPAITRLDVAGQVRGSWTVPFVNGGLLSSIQVKISFLQTSASGPILSTLAISQATLALAGKPISVSGSTLPGTLLLTLTLLPTGPHKQVFSLHDALAFLSGSSSSLAPQGISLFDQIQLSGVQLSFGFAPGSSTYFEISADANGDWDIIDGGLFALKGVGVSVLAVHRPAKAGGADLSLAGNVHATTRIASSDFQILLYLLGRNRLEFDVLPSSTQVLPGLAELAGHLGGEALKSAVQDGVKALGLGDISIDRIRVGFDLVHRKLLYVTLQSHLTLAGGQIFLYTQLPDFSFYGGLPPAIKGQPAAPSRISVQALATHVFGEAADLPELAITQLCLFAYPGQGTYRIEVLTEEDWKWDPTGRGTGPFLALENLGVNLERSPQSVSGGITVGANLGGFEIVFNAQYLGKGLGWLFTGLGATEHGVPVGTFLQDVAQKIGASVPPALLQAVQSLEIHQLTVVFDTHQKSFQFTADTTTTGQIPLGPRSYELDTRVFLTSTLDPSTGQRVFTGHMEADLQIGKALFLVSYDLGANVKTFIGRWRTSDGSTIGFNDLAEALGIEHTISVPDGLDLGLQAASFEYHAADNFFTLAAESSHHGDAFFTAGKGQTGTWGFVFGIDFPPKAKLSSLPVIGSDLKVADFLTFQQFAILLSSTTFKNYTLPVLPPLPAPSPSATSPGVGRLVGGRSVKPIAAGASLQVSPGLSLAAMLDLAASSSDARMRNLASIVGKPELLVQVTMGESGVSLFIALAGAVSIPAGGTSKLTLGSPAMLIVLSTEIVFQLVGSIELSVNGAAVDATVRMILDESEAQVTVDISGDHGSLPSPPGVKGLHLTDFGIAMGVFFEPPGVDLGILGKLRIGEVQGTRSDEFAIVLEMIEEIPDLLYLSFYIDKLDLGQVVTLFTDKSEPASVQALEVVKASDLSFYFAENVIVLPDGTIAQPGFGVRASIQMFSFGAHADLEIGLTQGLKGHAEMAPINLRNVLRISGDGKGIHRTYQQIDGQWQLVNNNSIVRQKPAPPTRQEVVVPPGGPIIEFDALRSPFIHVNWQITLFDLEKTRVDVTVSNKGASFLLSYQVAGIEKFDLNATLQDLEHFSASAAFHLGLDARVGPIHVLGVDCGSLHLVARADAGMELVLDPSRFSLRIHGDFDFEGIKFSIPDLTLSVAPASLKELPEKIIQQIKDHADQMFAALFADAQKWAVMIARGVITNVSNMARALKNVYKVTAEDAARLMKAANQAVNTVASGLQTAYGLTGDAATAAMKGAGYAAEQIADGLKQAYGLTAQGAITVLKGAGFAAGEVGNALKTAYSQAAQQATVLLRGAGYAVGDIGHALAAAYGASANQAAQLLKGAAYAANEVGSALQSAYGATASVATGALKGAGYAAGEVGGMLRSVYGQTAQQAASVMRSAGYAADQVGTALKSAYGVTVDQAAVILRGAGYGINDVGNALKSAYGATADVAASALKKAGYAVNETGDFAKNAYNLGPDRLKSVLSNAGYAGDQIKDFFHSLGGAFADAFKDVGKKLDPTHW